MAQENTDTRTNLIGLDRADLASIFKDLDEPAFRARQLWHWMYHRGETDFDKMTDLSKGLRAKLPEYFRVGRLKINKELISEDTTQKWLLGLDDGNEVEAVMIPEKDRGALCVSSQVGCALNCSFCHTGTQTWVGDLQPADIVGQVMSARDRMDEWPSGKKGRRLTNIVMMGMGEPLLNFANVAKALKIVMDSEGISISKRRITLSTSGVVPMMKRCAEELDVGLAVSLHASNDELRNELVPINKKYPLAQLLQACADYPSARNARRITMEYVMLKDVNDSLADAKELVRLMKKYEIHAKFNLIGFNPWPGSIYECSSGNAMHRFSDYLNDQGFSAPIRASRGRDIMAACGQLKSASENQKMKALKELKQQRAARA
ncbi:MAG: 23S rRNA (adenine(2503)-C(2))-methyltransferase RlmN [Rhodospirillaceae bacterium]|nr:23S rRNA (adenine(2503)-C(2))-methyltransferase RlmN [Rhodospirillaceae bacterium]